MPHNTSDAGFIALYNTKIYFLKPQLWHLPTLDFSNYKCYTDGWYRNAKIYQITLQCTTLFLVTLNGSGLTLLPGITHKNRILLNVNFECFILDIDECENGQNNCDGNARCTNTIGSFTCACKNGFYGDGVTCGGKRMNL